MSSDFKDRLDKKIEKIDYNKVKKLEKEFEILRHNFLILREEVNYIKEKFIDNKKELK